MVCFLKRQVVVVARIYKEGGCSALFFYFACVDTCTANLACKHFWLKKKKVETCQVEECALEGRLFKKMCCVNVYEITSKRELCPVTLLLLVLCQLFELCSVLNNNILNQIFFHHAETYDRKYFIPLTRFLFFWDSKNRNFILRKF